MFDFYLMIRYLCESKINFIKIHYKHINEINLIEINE